ncbi:hypothetical protein L3Q82_009592 [Scortum barcoo]|uniref:Uncharacterized protein n=1 Tax=Scortum barcoo TaxID=214431 RepID=A0ACB8WGX0_9TELE|nr:hypothetical protein L3Q82_009592 [Scortum barcoo]
MRQKRFCKPPQGRRLFLKVSKVVLRNGDHTLETYAILDDGSEGTLLLHSAAQQLGLQGQPENLHLWTVRQELQMLHGAAVSFTISSANCPKQVFNIKGAFTAQQLGLGQHTYPAKALRRKFRHLRDSIHPLFLVGLEHPHLKTPVEPVRGGSLGVPVAVRTHIGWTLQGPIHGFKHYLMEQPCLYTSYGAPSADIYQQVERLWQMDVLPWQSEKAGMRSCQDQEALQWLDAKTQRVEVDEKRSDSAEKWISEGQPDQRELALGLKWHCLNDTLSYKTRALRADKTTMRSIYKVLASQYDPMEFLVPYTTRAKILVQRLWDNKRDWDDPALPEHLMHAWKEWEDELSPAKHNPG